MEEKCKQINFNNFLEFGEAETLMNVIQVQSTSDIITRSYVRA